MAENFPTSPSTNDIYYGTKTWIFNGTYWDRYDTPRREKLTSDKTYYIRTDGNDSNAGLTNTSGGAFLTIQKAWDVAVSTLDLNNFTAILQIGQSGQTFTGGLVIKSEPIGGEIILDLGGSTLTVTGTHCINVANFGKITLRNGTLSSITSGNILFCRGQNSEIIVGPGITFANCVAGFHIRPSNGGTIKIENNYTITGSALCHLCPAVGAKIFIKNITITLVGSLSFDIFALTTVGGLLDFYNSTCTGGTITGKRYNVDTGVINTYGAGANCFPGDSAGTGGTTPGDGFYA